MKKWFIIVAMLCSIDTLRSHECAVACRYLFYNGGDYSDSDCYCYDKKKYSEIVHVQIIHLGKKTSKEKKGDWSRDENAIQTNW